MVYCDNCYESQAPHDPESPQRVQHEKTELKTAELILSILSPQTGGKDEQLLHEQNMVTKWFGAMIDDRSGKPHLHDFGRFSKLAGGSEMEPDKIFPCLVSFVGETGAGKSTLINILVKVRLPTSIESSC